MRPLLLVFLSTFLNINSLTAQVKSTGIVNLLSGMTAKIDLNNNNQTVTLTFSGPSDRWYALQFGNFSFGDGMKNGEDIVYFNGNTLVDAVHNGVGTRPTDDSINNWSLTSNTVSSGIRTIIATRPFNTGDSNDYIFNFQNNTIDFAYSRSQSANYILAYHGFSNRGYSISNSFTTLGVDNHDLVSKEVKLIPNPASSSFVIHSNFDHNIVNTTIYNSLGQNVLYVKNTSSEINISQLPNGNYYVEIEDDLGSISMKKLIVK